MTTPDFSRIDTESEHITGQVQENDSVEHWEEALQTWTTEHPDDLKAIDETGKNPSDGSDVHINCRRAAHNLRKKVGLV